MTHVGPAPMSSSAASTPGASFVEWGAVLAGAVLAAAITFVLLTFGAAIGLSATSPWPNSGASAKLIASLAVFWAMAAQIGAFMAGGYVAGRMRSRWHETGHEAEFRDGLHGGLVWAVGVVIGAALFLSTAGAPAKTGADSEPLTTEPAKTRDISARFSSPPAARARGDVVGGEVAAGVEAAEPAAAGEGGAPA